jgi:peptidoglycan/LPS O-acetylase OafA/YrhL
MNRLAALMALEAISLAVMSFLHLIGKLDGSPPFDPTRAGVAEAAIGVVLLFGALAIRRRARHAWGIALAANIFAVVGFAVGLTRTTQGGGAIDIAYHVLVLPLLVLALAVLLRPRHRDTPRSDDRQRRFDVSA